MTRLDRLPPGAVVASSEPAPEASRPKYGNVRTYSELCGRAFDSAAEAKRGEELALLERGGAIFSLEYQPRWVLSEKPRLTYTADFSYHDGDPSGCGVPRHGACYVVEDVKGVLTRDTRTRLAWLLWRYDLRVRLLRLVRGAWEEMTIDEPKNRRGRSA